MTRSRFSAVINHKCPRCRQGDLFEYPIGAFKKMFYMPPSCKKCGLGYYPEPGFYYGAMFISYIITAFYCLGFVGICIFLFDLGVELSFVLLFISLMIFYVWFYRTARSLWIHINVRYDRNAIDKAKENGAEKMPGYVNRNF